MTIGADAACSLLATGPDDKKVRLWFLIDGKLKRVIRLPIGEGDAGKVYATSLSPDGRWLAVGGYDAAKDKTGESTVTMLDFLGRAIRRLHVLDAEVDHVAFSADGRLIAVGLGGVSGVRVYDSVLGAELLADRDYGDDVRGLAFASDGALITSSFDGQLRRYDPDLKLTAKRPALGRRPREVAIDPSGRRVAMGFASAPARVSIFDATTFTHIAQAETGDFASGDLPSVGWSRDGTAVVAGGGVPAGFTANSSHVLRRFDASGRRQGADVEASSYWIQDIQRCGDRFAFSASRSCVRRPRPTRRRDHFSTPAYSGHAMEEGTGVCGLA